MSCQEIQGGQIGCYLSWLQPQLGKLPGLSPSEEWFLGQIASTHNCPVSRLSLLASITFSFDNQPPISTHALIDSGAKKSFIDASYVTKLSLSTTPLAHPIQLNMADGNSSLHGPITHQTTLQLTIGNHSEDISLHITQLHSHPIILGIDWL